MKFDYTIFFQQYRAQFQPRKLTQEAVEGLEILLNHVEADKLWTPGCDVQEVAYLLATIKRECADRFQPITEYGNKSYFDKYNRGTKIGAALGNTEPGDGFLYRGRGYVQITGRANYAKFSTRLGLSLISFPDNALFPPVSYHIAVTGMREGLFTGKRFSDYITPAKCDYHNARRIINGLDKAAMIATYAVKFESILTTSRIDTV